MILWDFNKIKLEMFGLFIMQSGRPDEATATLGQWQQYYRKQAETKTETKTETMKETKTETEMGPEGRKREKPDASTATLGQWQEYYRNTPPRQGTVPRNMLPNRNRVRPVPRPTIEDLGPIELPELLLEGQDS